MRNAGKRYLCSQNVPFSKAGGGNRDRVCMRKKKSFRTYSTQTTIQSSMSLRTIDRAGIPVWCPIASSKSMIAVGGTGASYSPDINMAVDLEIYSLDADQRTESIAPIAHEKVDSAFRAIAWADVGPAFPLGVVAGGLSSGAVGLWDASRLVSFDRSSPSRSRGGSSLIFSQHLHGDRPVTCLEFNPQKPTLLATGGSDGMVQVASIERPQQPEIFRGVTTTKHMNSEVLCVSWNRKVQHILASVSNQGLLVVWDLKNKKEVVTIKDPGNRTRPSSLSWNPDVPTQLLVSYNDDNNPCIQLWDMRNCSYPFREFQEHTRGVTCASFCDIDPNLIASSARDNRGVCWSLHSGRLEPYSDLNIPSPATKLDWSPHLHGFIAASQTSGIISVHSISQRQTSVAARYPPRWTKMPCGASFGFGGKLVSFGSRQSQTVSIHVVPDDPAVANEADRFEQFLAADLRPFCSSKAVEAHEDHEKLTWNLISLLFYGPDARGRVIETMGIDSSEIQGLAEKYLGRPMNAPTAQPTLPPEYSLERSDGFTDAGTLDPDQLDDLFDQLAKNSEQQATAVLSVGHSRRESPRSLSHEADSELTPTDWSKGPEAIIKQSLLVGDISTSVDCCMKCGRFADALFIAAAGGPELWNRVREEYSRKQRDPFIRLVGYVMSQDLEKAVQQADLNSWVETLAVLVTYSRPENFTRQVEMLAERLEKERFDIRSAVLCYLACGSFSNTVRIWASMSHTQSSQSQALQGLVEKMSCLFSATRPAGVDPIFSHKMHQYATLLANSGRIMAAMRCLILVPDNTETRILKHRIYNAAPSVMGQLLRAPPPFPFETADIRPLTSPHTQQIPAVARTNPASAFGVPPGQGSYPGPSQATPAMPAFTQQAVGTPTPPSQAGYGNRPYNSGGPNHGVFPSRSNPGLAPPPNVSVPVIPVQSGPPVAGFQPGFTQPLSSSIVNSPGGVRSGPPVSHPPSQFGPPSSQDPAVVASVGVPGAGVTQSSKVQRPPSTIPQRAQLPPQGPTVSVNSTIPQHKPLLASVPGTSRMIAPQSPQRTLPNVPQTVSGDPLGPPAGWGYLPPEQGVGGGPPTLAAPDMSYRSVTGPPTSGGVSTAPHATANPVTPGLPTSWPVPTPVQQQLSPGIVPPPKSAMLAAGPLNDPVPQNEISIIQHSFTELLARCAQDGNRRKWDDIGKKLSELYDKLATGQISRESVGKIKEMCLCIDRGDFVSASRLRVELSAGDWEKNRTWLFAVQLLLPK